MKYPNTAVVNQIDDYHGVRVADPYRWLEDSDSPETREWIEAQNELTFSYLERLPGREKIRQKLTRLWDFERRMAPYKHGGRYFQLRNNGLQNQDVLYTFPTLEAEARILLDPNGFSEDGTVALTEWSVSKDGKRLAYATSAAGSDWLIWHIRDVDSGEDLPDQLEWSKFSTAAWLPDASGFYYERYEEPEPGKGMEGINEHQKLYLHILGKPQAEDVLVYERPDHKDWGFSPEVTEDGSLLVVHVWQGTDIRNRVFYQDLKASGAFVELIPDLEANYQLVDKDGDRLYFRTDLEAPRGRLIEIDLNHPGKEDWTTIIAESEDVLEAVRVVNHLFVGLYLHHAHHQIRLFAKDGTPDGEVELPGIGSVMAGIYPGVTGNRDDREMFYAFSSFAHPAAVYRYDFLQRENQLIFFPDIAFDFHSYETQQVFARSKDGTRVPMFLIHRAGLALDGQNPTLLYGYGGFNISLTPQFQTRWLAWLGMGGVLAVANLRGGGEYGEEWHQAGMLHKKQNVFDDFIACAEFLIADGITSPSKLAIQGGSNGGLLVGACMEQRPELFGAANAAVGVMDMLRFHKFTIGWAWVSDYGSPEDPEQFKTIYAYSPLHNLKADACYPPTLITTGDHDDRVVPGHSFKFAAALQAAQGCDNPVLIRIQTRAGHGLGKPTAILIAEHADIFAFFAEALGIRAFQE